VNKHRSYLLAILRFAKRRRVASFDWLDWVERVPVPRRVPRAWTIAEVERILAAARQAQGTIDGVAASVWHPALILTLYDTGLRIAACLSIRRDDVSLSERAVLVRAERQKQNADQWLTLSDQTIAAIAPLLFLQRELLFGRPGSWPAIRRRFVRILQRAGVSYGHANGGVFHKLRKTCASYCKANGVDPTSQLGHSGAGVTRAYLDPRITQTIRPSDALPRPRIVDSRQRRLF
jgi:integrase